MANTGNTASTASAGTPSVRVLGSASRKAVEGAAPTSSMVRLSSGDFFGMEGRPVDVQVDVSDRGSPGFNVVGLAGKSIRESRERIRAAISNSGFAFPFKSRILVNLAPAGEEKQGSGFDLAISLGILLAGGLVPHLNALVARGGLVEGFGFLGELGLNGEVCPVPGALLVANTLRARDVSRIVVAPGNAREAALVEGIAPFVAADLHQALQVLEGKVQPFRVSEGPGSRAADPAVHTVRVDFSEVRGQEATKRGLLVAAAGGHNVLMSGPPGVGKTLLARCFPGILPAMTFAEALDVTRIASILGQEIRDHLIEERPFRAPHHTISYAGLVGGGSRMRPGEVTRAHRGVLFLDELPEFNRRALEALREPLEAGSITVGRSAGAVTFPAQFLLIAAMNPCPCGFFGHPRRPCACSPLEVRTYRHRISGPLLDRIDLFLAVGAVEPGDLVGLRGAQGSGSRELRQAVARARTLEAGRWGSPSSNSAVPLSRLLKEGEVREGALKRLQAAAERLALSVRGFARSLRVARTVADLAASPHVEAEHVVEALQYRES